MRPWRHPYSPRLRRRYLHQSLTYRPTIRAWRAALLSLMQRPFRPTPDPLRHAYDHVLYWQRVISSTSLARHQLDFTTLSRLPVLERATIQAELLSLCATNLPKRWRDDIYQGKTSGSTGEPLVYRIDAAAFHAFLPFVDFVLRWTRARRPRPGSTGIVLLDALGHSPEYGAWLPLFHWTRFQKLRVDRPGWRDRLARLDPGVITGDPDSIAALLNTRARPQLVLSSAFPLDPGLSRTLSRYLNCPVVEYYSAQETGPIAVRCRHHALHVLTPFVHVEDRPIAGGRELLITDLRNRAMPLLRYAIGDLGRISHSPCPCGLQTPLIESFTGRVAQRFKSRAGPYDPARLAPSLTRVPITEYRLAERTPSHVDLEYRGTLKPSDLSYLQSELSRIARAPVTLHARRVETPLRAPGVKPRPFVPRGHALDPRAASNHDAPVAGRPHRVYVAVTNACNRACPWCSTYSDPSKDTWITPEQFKAALPAEGPFELQLEGGEPTLHPNLAHLVQLAQTTGRCTRTILCTNAVRLPRAPARLREWLAEWPRPLTIKASLNHHLMEADPNHVAFLRTLVTAAEAADVTVVINLRRRQSVDDAWVRAAADAAGLGPWCNDFPLQRYGLAQEDTSLDPPFLAGTDFTLINPDGRAYGTDLIARSEAMGALP